MTKVIPRLTRDGYSALWEIALNEPSLFITPDVAMLRQRLAEKGSEEMLFDEPVVLEASLESLNDLASSPGNADPFISDAGYSSLMREALAGISPRQAASREFWASINCFAVHDYVPTRWPTKNIKKGQLSTHVQEHWLNLSGAQAREKNAAARLWWLGEVAHRAAPFSTHDEETLRLTFANHPSFYHRLLYRPLILRMPRLSAAICDFALDGNDHLFQHKHIDVLVRRLLDIAANSSLDLMPDDQLRRIVQENAPKKVGDGSR